jgi:hypothetical protein
MNWNLYNAMRWGIMSALLITGCAMTDPSKKHCTKPLKLPPVDWIMVSGTSLPATTVVIGECGLTLADSLVMSRTIEKLGYQSEVASKSSIANKLSDSQGSELYSILKDQALDAVSFDSAVGDVAVFLQSRSWLDLPDDWHAGFPDSAFDRNLGSERDRQTIAAQIQELNPRLRMEATIHFEKLIKTFADKTVKDFSDSDSARASMDYLRSLAQDGRLIVGDYQKLKCWCYSTQRNQSDAEKANKAIASSFGTKSTAPVMGNVSARETMMVLVHRGSRCVVIPLPLVFESAFGGYWVEPGDHLFLARFGELPFRNQMNDLNELKQVGITGMISSQGVWPTETRSLESVVSSFRGEIDLRADMMMVAQVQNNVVFQCMLPYSMTSLSVGRSTQMEALVREWGLVDGQVVSFQNSGLSPLLVASTQKLRRATDLHRRMVAGNSKLCQHDQASDLTSCTTESESTKSIASRFALANDACQTFQDSLKSMRGFTSDSLSNLPFPGN